MKFFKKADEMEMEINFKAMRLAWVFENIALVIWLIVSYIKSESSFIPFMIIIIQNLVFFRSKLYLSKKMAEGNDEK